MDKTIKKNKERKQKMNKNIKEKFLKIIEQEGKIDIFVTMYGGTVYNDDIIKHTVKINDLSKDKTCFYYVWGMTFDINIYEFSDYGKTWAFNLQEFDNYTKPIVYGEWIPNFQEVEDVKTGETCLETTSYHCSVCNDGYVEEKRNFCPDCGCKMCK